MTQWSFPNPPTLAVITLRKILQGEDWIAYVTHDEDDGSWQFHGGGESDMNDAALVSLSQIVELDPSINALADLPVGWYAQRESPTSPWRRAKIEAAGTD